MLETKLSELITDYIQGRAQARLEKFDKDADKQRKALPENSPELAELNAKLASERAQLDASFKPANWLSDAAKRARQISMVTHALKFTHSDARGTSILASAEAKGDVAATYLSTAALQSLRIDVVGNAAALDVASLLQLQTDGTSLNQMIAQGDSSSLAPFAETDEQLQGWLTEFQAALADKLPSSHKLAKQLYFPVGRDYHLVSPLYASSLAQAVYERVAASRYPDEAKAARKAKREGKYSPSLSVDFPNTAVQSFGGTKPQNISQLNSSRGGKSFLLSCQPPVWKTQTKPPADNKNAFWQGFDRRAWATARSLRKFLEAQSGRDSTVQIRQRRARYLDELVGLLLQYAAEVQSLTEHAGWSQQSKLPDAEQLWLDPLRDDADFQARRAGKGWQEVVADRFARWLNGKLAQDKLVLKDAEYHEWSKLVQQKLSLLADDLEVMA